MGLMGVNRWVQGALMELGSQAETRSGGVTPKGRELRVRSKVTGGCRRLPIRIKKVTGGYRRLLRLPEGPSGRRRRPEVARSEHRRVRPRQRGWVLAAGFRNREPVRGALTGGAEKRIYISLYGEI